MLQRNKTISKSNRRPHTFRRGEWAEVRSLEEIQATLDADGKLDGLPFMPEMIKYCGKRFRVSRRADRIFLDRYWYVAKLKETVFLQNLRCDGLAHDDCQMRCELFWNEAWLMPADPPDTLKEVSADQIPSEVDFTTRKENQYICQATELVHASKYLPWWDLRQYFQEVMLGETTILKLFSELSHRAIRKLFRIFRRQYKAADNFIIQPTPTEHLNLQPGEWVEVKSLAEIKATLDANNRNRGLAFASEQAEFCGKRLRVAGRVEKIIIEWSGELRPISNTVELEESTCQGRMCRSCPRNCYHLSREIWLRRAAGPK